MAAPVKAPTVPTPAVRRAPRAERVPRADRPAAPPMPPFEALDRAHREVLAVLGEFARLLDHLEDHGPDETARATAHGIASFFVGEARAHHAAEERHVFPQLLASGDAELVHQVRRLQQDHGWLEEDWLELEPQIDAIALGYTWYDLAMLRAALPVFDALYREHVALEESLIYPAAKRHAQALAEGADARLG